MNLAESLRRFIPSFPDAKCQDLDPDFMFPDTELQLMDRLPQMIATCQSCVHRIECRDYALDETITEGFWGGTTPTMRRKIWKKERIGLGRGTQNLHADKIAIFVKRYKAGVMLVDIADSLNVDARQVQSWKAIAIKKGWL